MTLGTLGMNESLGLTLLELVVTLAVALIVLTIGAPLYQSFQANNRAIAQSSSLVAALTLARSEAVARGVPVAVCARVENAETCDGSSDHWANGWLVFVDDNSDGQLTGSEKLIRLGNALGGSPTVTFGSAFVIFLADGTTASAGTVGMHLHQEGAKGTQDRCITITSIGQVRTSRMNPETSDASDCP